MFAVHRATGRRLAATRHPTCVRNHQEPLVKQHLVYLSMVIALAAVGAGAGGCGAWGNKQQAKTNGSQPVPANSFVQGWANDLHLRKERVDELHLRGDTLFVYTDNHLVYGVDRAGGNTKYLAQPQVSGGILRPPLPVGEWVVYPSGSTIDILTNRGRPARTIELEKPIRSGAVGDATKIYIGLDHYEGAGTVAKIDISRPYKVIDWELMTEAAVSPTPALHKRILYIGSEDGRIYAVSDERGQVWSLEEGKGWFQTQGKFVSDIKVDDTGVYASNTDSKLYCLDPQTGRIRWQYWGSAALKTAPVVTATMVYQLVPGQGIVGLDKLQGEFNRKPRWIIKDARQVLSEDEQNVYLRRRDNRLMAVNKQSGEVVFTSKGNAYTTFATNPNDGIIFAGTKDGHLVAVRPVLREGEVGVIVRDLRAEPIAAAK
jgi:outer membrane protein assembly factor BamB